MECFCDFSRYRLIFISSFVRDTQPQFMFLAFIFVLFLNAPKQIFYVSFVKGDVILERTNTFLKVGDEIFDTDKIKFVSEDALISVLSENGKRDKIN